MKIFAKIKFIFKNKIKKFLLISLLLTILLSVFGWQYQSKILLSTGRFLGFSYREIYYNDEGIPIVRGSKNRRTNESGYNFSNSFKIL